MHVEHLRQFQAGVVEWNAWRAANPAVEPNLSGSDLNQSITKSTLFKRKSTFAGFQQRSAQSYDLRGADLRFSRIWLMELQYANLSNADLEGAELRFCDLQHATLRGANLQRTQLLGCDLRNADLSGARLGATHLGFVTLGANTTAAEIQHVSPSHVDQFTLLNSSPFPDAFTAACHVPPQVLRVAELFRTVKPYRRCFLSYSRRDELFTMYLREALTWHGVPSWFAPADMRNPRLHRDERELERDLYTYVDEADLTLLIASPNILSSAWVGKEFQRALPSKPIVVVLIDTLPTPSSPQWHDAIRRTLSDGIYTQLNPDVYSAGLQEAISRKMMDFRAWRDPVTFAQSFVALLGLLRQPPTNGVASS